VAGSSTAATTRMHRPHPGPTPCFSASWRAGRRRSSCSRSLTRSDRSSRAANLTKRAGPRAGAAPAATIAHFRKHEPAELSAVPNRVQETSPLARIQQRHANLGRSTALTLLCDASCVDADRLAIVTAEFWFR
jgi:hypothetical protein